MYKYALETGSIGLLVVDEAHLFAQFGLWFRDEFIAMKSLAFDPLTNDGGCTSYSSPGMIHDGNGYKINRGTDRRDDRPVI
jgi:hypothetical protein